MINLSSSRRKMADAIRRCADECCSRCRRWSARTAKGNPLCPECYFLYFGPVDTGIDSIYRWIWSSDLEEAQ